MTSAVGLRSERGPVLLALMLSTGLIAIDATILATAVATISDDLGGFAQFPWLFSVYLLAQAVSVPIFSKLSDTLGRKPLMFVGIALFLLGSILCGLAWSMPALIVFRAIQGLGAGAIMPVSITIAGDIYTVKERARAQGYIASVWAIASVVGPTLGGLFAQLDAWRWIFFINIPLCVLAGVLIWRGFKETSFERHEHRIDWAGAATLTAGSTLLILAVLEGGQAWAWDSPVSIALFVIGALLVVAFVLVERRAAEPVLPLGLLGGRLVLTTTLMSIGVGAALIGLTSFVPNYLQRTLGVSPLLAGLALAALTVGWPLAATLSGRLFYLRYGFRPTVLIGAALTLVGTGGIALTASAPNIVVIALLCFVVGAGLGLVASPSLIAVQSSVDWSRRGVVTGANVFARALGSAVGVAIFGAVSNAVLAGRPETDAAAVTSASAAVFVGVLVVAAATLIATLAMPQVLAPRTGAVPTIDDTTAPI